MMKRYLFIKVFSAILIIFFFFGCSFNRITKEDVTAFTANSDDYYQNFSISKSDIKPWEDGMRTTGDKGSYEWWYFDSTLKDGSTLVIVFYTKGNINPDDPMKPSVTLELVRPDGTTVHKAIETDAGDFSAARDKCDVKIKTNTFSGDLHNYTIHVDIDDVQADIKLHGTVPSWRPDTGYFIYKNKDKEDYYAWLPSVPQGNVEGTITIAGQSQAVTGVGYHDHNWGGASMLKLIHNWYWGRAQIGNYSVITSYVTAADEYGNVPIPILMLARDGKIIADDSGKVKFSVDDVYTDSYTGKPVANTIVYDYNDDVNHYRITFKRDKDLLRKRFVDTLHGLKWIMAKLAGMDGAYLRFNGQVTLDRLEGNKIVETVSEKAAVWELMYFGHARMN